MAFKLHVKVFGHDCSKIENHISCKEMEKIDDNAAFVSTWTPLSPTNKNNNQYFA